MLASQNQELLLHLLFGRYEKSHIPQQDALPVFHGRMAMICSTMFGMIVLFILTASFSYAETTKTIFNPFTNKLDYITTLSSSTLPSGSTNYVSRAGDTILGDLQFTSNSIGPVLTDSSGCTWRTTVATTGNLITTLINCPAVIVSRPCTKGMSIGLLLSLTCNP